MNHAGIALSIVARQLYRLRTAPDGQKHYLLRAAACTIGGLLTIAEIGEGEAVERLVEAVRDANAVNIPNAVKMAQWGIAKGAQSPLVIGGAR